MSSRKRRSRQQRDSAQNAQGTARRAGFTNNWSNGSLFWAARSRGAVGTDVTRHMILSQSGCSSLKEALVDIMMEIRPMVDCEPPTAEQAGLDEDSSKEAEKDITAAIKKQKADTKKRKREEKRALALEEEKRKIQVQRAVNQLPDHVACQRPTAVSSSSGVPEVSNYNPFDLNPLDQAPPEGLRKLPYLIPSQAQTTQFHHSCAHPTSNNNKKNRQRGPDQGGGSRCIEREWEDQVTHAHANTHASAHTHTHTECPAHTN